MADFWAYVNKDEFENEFYYSKTLEEKIKKSEQKALVESTLKSLKR